MSASQSEIAPDEATGLEGQGHPAFVVGYAKWVTEHPYKVLAASLLLAIALSLGLASLTFRDDSRVFFAHSNPELLALEKFERVYGRDDTLVFVVRAKTGDLFTPDRLAALNELTDSAWRLPHVKRVDSVTNFQHVTADGDDISIDQLARAGDSLDPQQARRLKETALQQPLLIGRLVSENGSLGLVAVSFRLDEKTASTATQAVMSQGRQLMERFNSAHTDLQAGLSGSVALDHAFAEASARDMSTLLPLMLIVLLGLIAASLRSVAGAGATFLVIVLGSVTALGVAGFLGIPLSSASVVAPNMILTLATCDCVHMCAAAMRLRSAGLSRCDAVRAALGEMCWPITLTTITTAIGFLSMVFSPVPPFVHLGIIVAIGTCLAWLFSLTLFPALLCVLPWSGSARPLPAQRLCAWIGRAVTERPSQVLVGVVLGTGTLAAFAFSNELDDRYVHYFDQRYEFRRATDDLNAGLGGFYQLEYSLDSSRPDGIADPQYLREVDRLAAWLREQPGVTHVHGLPDVIKTIHRAMNGDRQDAFALPDSREVIAQYLALYEMSLPIGADLKSTITVDKQHSRLSVALADVSTGAMTELADRAEQWAHQNTPLLANSSEATGTSLLFAHIGLRNIHEMLKGVFTAGFVVWIIFLVAFRSFFLSLIGTVANLLPALVTLGAWALIVGEVGMAVATVAAVTFGVVVDDTIHFLTAVSQRTRKEKKPLREAIQQVFEQVGPGMMATTVALCAGFACLAFSGFQINSSMGLLAAITIAVALLFDFLFIPATLMKFWRVKA